MLSINQHKYRRSLLRPVVILAAALVVAAGVLVMRYTSTPAYAQSKENGGHQRGKEMEIPVTAATAKQQAMPVWIDALGTVTPRNYANVMPRVSGLLKSINFKEGQPVAGNH